MCETNDSLLWVGAGNTLLKINIQQQKQGLEAKKIQAFNFDVPHKQKTIKYILYIQKMTPLFVLECVVMGSSD